MNKVAEHQSQIIDKSHYCAKRQKLLLAFLVNGFESLFKRNSAPRKHLRGKPCDDLSFRADCTFTEAYDEVLREELMRRPKHKASLDARWQATPKLSLDASLLYVSSWIDVNREFIFQQLTQPGFTTVNIAANYDIDDHFALYGRAANLLDEYYQRPNGFLAPSLGSYIGIKVRE